jgi:hypothetical protein
MAFENIGEGPHDAHTWTLKVNSGVNKSLHNTSRLVPMEAKLTTIVAGSCSLMLHFRKLNGSVHLFP